MFKDSRRLRRQRDRTNTLRFIDADEQKISELKSEVWKQQIQIKWLIKSNNSILETWTRCRHYDPLFVLFQINLYIFHARYNWQICFTHRASSLSTLNCMHFVCLVNNFDWFCKRYDWVQKWQAIQLLFNFLLYYSFLIDIRAMICLSNLCEKVFCFYWIIYTMLWNVCKLIRNFLHL